MSATAIEKVTAPRRMKRATLPAGTLSPRERHFLRWRWVYLHWSDASWF